MIRKCHRWRETLFKLAARYRAMNSRSATGNHRPFVP